jgi:hypothetical protein
MGFRAIERVKNVHHVVCRRKSCLNFVTTLPVSIHQENYLREIFQFVTLTTKTIAPDVGFLSKKIIRKLGLKPRHSSTAFSNIK